MDVRPAVQRDDRRRRVLAEETSAATATVSRPNRSGRDEAPRYSAAAHPQKQRPITDLVPVRYRWHVLGWVGAITAIAGLEAGYFFTQSSGTAPGPRSLAALDLAVGGSLAGWFRSAVMALAAGFAMLVLLIRRHKRDDYRGSYRVWLWAAICWLLASAEASAGWTAAFAEGMVRVTGWTGPLNGLVWQLAPAVVVMLPVAIRLVLDMRECQASTILFITGGVLGLAGLVTSAGAYSIGGAPADMMLAAGLVVAGNLFVLSAMSWHARFVLLDAQGELSARKRKRRAAVESQLPATSQGTKSPEFGQKPMPATAPTAKAATIPMSVKSLSGLVTRPTLSTQQESEEPMHRLSRAERRRLKREQRRAA
jgi:hypothetical protein